MSPRPVSGSVFLDGDRPCYFIKYRDPVQKKTVKKATGFSRDDPTGRAQAEEYLRYMVESFSTAMTVNLWADAWLKSREGRADHHNATSRLRDHVRPLIGPTPLANVTPADINSVIQRMKSLGLAPRTVRNAYSDLSAMFRDAAIAGHIEPAANPCILESAQLGPIEDKESGWRDTAVFSRTELRLLLTDPGIPLDRQVQYALLGLGALRDGEMVALRWGEIKPGKPLNRMRIRRSHDKDRTKTVLERWMPIHPALYEMLERWAKEWPAIYGKPIGEDDLVMPTGQSFNRGPRVPKGVMRTNNYVYKRWVRDLDRLGLRHRRIHDLRRTFISLAKSDGAVEGILKLGTHAAPRHVMGLYSTVEWNAVCAEVAKLNFSLLPVESEERDSDLRDQELGRGIFIQQENQEVAS